MAYRQHTIVVRGQQVRVLRGGSGLPLLYFHDTFCTTWMPLHERLAAHYDVILPIHPGCAGSDGGEQLESMEDLVFHYLDVCATLSLERPLLLGTSFGGWLAAELAMRYPDKLRALCLVDALGLRIPEAPCVDLFRLEAPQLRATLFANPALPLAFEVIPDSPSPAALPGILQARQVLARFAWQFPDNPKLARYLYRIRVPTLVVWGQQDAVVPVAHGHAYHQAIAAAELVVLPQCGHLPHAEQPEALLHALLTASVRLNHTGTPEA